MSSNRAGSDKVEIDCLKDSTYQWWNTLIAVVPKDRVNWDFFQTEFKKKYISQRYLDKKRNEFLELKQGHRSIAQYEKEFMQLSKYSWECIPIEVVMCNQFEDGLNEDIKLLVGVLGLKEFTVMVDQTNKADELSKAKRKADFEARDTGKRPMGKSFSFPSKKLKEFHSRTSASTRLSGRDKGKQHSSSRPQVTSIVNVGSVRNNKPECQ
ncbi:uncharacterized protein [Gossypium hirsutum]|uniref:Retrotransposon gag domain-containing protein n=1 Tax=Gossypium hirsutum TaxID=3635 RepID=A0A1U8IRW2_GOSHI|nr:uncharacterized protein LOC107898130 [Gossypium hirsutum]